MLGHCNLTMSCHQWGISCEFMSLSEEIESFRTSLINRAFLGISELYRSSCPNTALYRSSCRSTLSVHNNRKGVYHASFYQERQLEMITCCHPESDILAFRVTSELLISSQYNLVLRFPYGNEAFFHPKE